MGSASLKTFRHLEMKKITETSAGNLWLAHRPSVFPVLLQKHSAKRKFSQFIVTFAKLISYLRFFWKVTAQSCTPSVGGPSDKQQVVDLISKIPFSISGSKFEKGTLECTKKSKRCSGLVHTQISQQLSGGLPLILYRHSSTLRINRPFSQHSGLTCHCKPNADVINTLTMAPFH